MTRLKLPEIVMMVLAVLGGLGILCIIGTRLMHVAADRTTAETGGISAVAGGFGVSLFTLIVVVVLAIVVVLAVFLWRR
jgi:uncharacterized membrane protein